MDNIIDKPAISDGAAGLCLVYMHPKIDFAKLRLACPYLNIEPGKLSSDQLAEILSVLDLLVTDDRSFSNWVQTHSKAQGIGQVESHRSREDIPLGPIARQMWFKELDNCTIFSDNKFDISSGLVKLNCYLEVIRHQGTSQYEITIDEARQTRYLGGYLQLVTSISADLLTCRFVMHETWDEYDCLSLRTALFSLPCIVIGSRTPLTRKELTSVPLDFPVEDTVIEPYLILAYPESSRLQPLIATSQLGETVRIAKQLWDKTQIEQIISCKLDNIVAQDRVRQNLAQIEQLIGTCAATSNLGSIVETLSEWLTGKPVIRLQKQQSLLTLLSVEDFSKTSLDSYNASSFLLHVLLRLSLVSDESSLTGLKVYLCLSHKMPNGEEVASSRILADEGHFVYIEIQDEGRRSYPLVNEADRSWTAGPITKICVPLYYTGAKQVPSLMTRIHKVLPTYADFPDIGGVTWGNLTSPFAVVSVGAMEETLISELLEMVAVAIELEDRPTRTANLPDPWPYNVSKTMKSVVANPNIRYLLIIGETEFCTETVARIGSKHAIFSIPNDIHIFIPETLVQAFQQQIIDVACLQGSLFENTLLWKRLQYLLSQGLQQSGELPDQSCQEGIPDRQRSHHGGGRDQRELDDLINKYVQRVNQSPDEKVETAELCARTVRRSQASLISMILKYGERKGPDSHGRTYADLLSYRAIISDITSELVLPGATFEQVDSFFQSQWLNPGGLFHTRLTESFGLNQIDSCISRIIETIRDGTVSRSVIMTVSHPLIDGKRPLGVNTIHFSFRQLAERRYQLIGAFEWRTVETLYALPYSMYTTCSFQKFITDECQRQIGPTYEVLYGEAIFLALNLHVYIDDLNYYIAELIVDEALQSMGTCQ